MKLLYGKDITPRIACKCGKFDDYDTIEESFRDIKTGKYVYKIQCVACWKKHYVIYEKEATKANT